MDLDGRRRAAADNLVDAFDLVRRHYANARGGRKSFGTVEVAAVGHEVAFYNAVVAVRPDVAVDDVLAALDWVEARDLAPCVHLGGDTDPAVGRRLGARGMRPAEERATVMVLDPIPPAHAAGPDVSGGTATSGGVATSGGPELAERWYTALEATPRLRATFGRGFVADPDVRIGVAELAGEPVAAAMAMRTGSVLGVYAVGTIERARRRGLGRAVTWAVIDAGVDAWQSRMAILQSSEMGRPSIDRWASRRSGRSRPSRGPASPPDPQLVLRRQPGRPSRHQMNSTTAGDDRDRDQQVERLERVADVDPVRAQDRARRRRAGSTRGTRRPSSRR